MAYRYIFNPGRIARGLILRKKMGVALKGYRDGGRVPAPGIIFVVLNSRCNLRCRMCELWRSAQEGRDVHDFAGTLTKQDMPISTFQSLIDSVKGFAPEIFLVCTEPLLYPDIFEAVSYVKKNRLRCQMTTNGTLLADKAKRLVECGIDQINVSLDAGCAEIHDAIRGVPGCFARAMEGLTALSAERMRARQKRLILGTSTVISPGNYFQIHEQVRAFSRLGLDFINFMHLCFVKNEIARDHNAMYPDLYMPCSGTLEYDPSEVDAVLLDQQIKKCKSEFAGVPVSFIPDIEGGELEKYYRHPQDAVKGYDRCIYPWRFSHVLPNGDVIVASRCFRKVMGNINRQSFKDIWQGSEYSDIRQRLRSRGAFYPCLRCSGIFCSNYL